MPEFLSPLAIQNGARIILGLLLLAASLSKLFTIKWFTDVVASWWLGPSRFAPYAARLVVAVELVLGILLLQTKLRAWAAFGSAFLFAMFALAVIVKLAAGKYDTKCGCFAWWKETKVGWQVVIRNLSLFGFAVICIGFPIHNSAPLLACLFALCLMGFVAPLSVSLLRQVGSWRRSIL